MIPIRGQIRYGWRSPARETLQPLNFAGYAADNDCGKSDSPFSEAVMIHLILIIGSLLGGSFGEPVPETYYGMSIVKQEIYGTMFYWSTVWDYRPWGASPRYLPYPPMIWAVPNSHTHPPVPPPPYYWSVTPPDHNP